MAHEPCYNSHVTSLSNFSNSMKALLAVLVLAIAAGVGYWKTQFPNATLDDIRLGAENNVARLQNGFQAARRSFSNAPPKESLTARLDAIQADLDETKKSANPTVVNERLTDIEKRLSTQSGNLDRINDINIERLGDIESRLSKQDSNISEVQTGLNSTQSELNTALDDIVSISNEDKPTLTQVSALEEQMALLGQRIDEQTEKFNAVGISEKLDQLKTQMIALETTNRDNADTQNINVNRLEEKIQSFEARINTLSVDTSNGLANAAATVNAQIDQRLALLENKLDTTTSDSKRITALTEQLSVSREKVRELESQYSDTSSQLARVNESIDELKTRNESSVIDDLQKDMREQLANLQAQIDTRSSDTNVKALDQQIQTTRDRIQQLEQRITELPAISNEASDAVAAQSALQAQIAALEQRVSAFDTAPDPQLINSISEVQQRVSALAAKSFVTQEDLQAQQEAKTIEYKIYFDVNSTSITDDAGKVLNSFITQEQNRTTSVSIYGFTDSRGSAVYNQRLAQQRANSVRSYLIQNGFDFTKISTVSGLGEDAAAALQVDGEEEAQQRTVVLYASQP